MDKLIGNFIQLSTDEGEYKGYIHSVDISRSKVTLEGVTIHPSGKTLDGLQHFYEKEIKSLNVLKEDETAVMKKTENSLLDEPGRGILISQRYPAHLSKMKNEIDRDILLNRVPYKSQSDEKPKSSVSKEKANDTVIRQTGSSSRVNRNRYSPPNLKRPSKFFVVDEINECFFKAMACIENESILGIGLEGVKVGRNGTLCWLNVACEDFVFLFDILALGKSCFQQRMKEILEHSHILKILHDSRLPSDCLHHQYGVSLINVFDTQVADMMVMRQEQMGTFPRYVQALAPCLMKYLPLNSEQVYFPRMRLGHEKEDLGIWKQRPLPDYLQEAAAKNVMYLRELRVVLLEAMLSDYTQGVDHYLSVIRDANDINAAVQQDSIHLLPAEFSQFESTMKKKVNQKFHIMKDEHGFCEVSQERCDPYVIYSRDVWHINHDQDRS